MMSFSTVIALESFALIDVVRCGINVSHVAANGDDVHFDNNQDPMCWMLKFHTHIIAKGVFLG